MGVAYSNLVRTFFVRDTDVVVGFGKLNYCIYVCCQPMHSGEFTRPQRCFSRCCHIALSLGEKTLEILFITNDRATAVPH